MEINKNRVHHNYCQ